MVEALELVGPIVVTLNANNLKHYSSGIINMPFCSRLTNHAVLAVGYGTDKSGVDYYIVKNSWGESWGEFLII